MIKMKSKEYITIKELADQLGVAKQTVQYHYKLLPDKENIVSDKGTILLNKDLQEILSAKIGKINTAKSTKESAKKSTKNTSKKQSNSEELLLLKKELKNKDKIIDELFNSQKNLQKLLDQQQILTLQANKKIEQLEMEQEQTEEKNDKNPEVEDNLLKEKPISFWQRLFGK